LGFLFFSFFVGLLPARVLEVVLLVALLILNHLGAERVVLLRRVLELLLEEVDGERDSEVLSVATEKALVAGLNHLARGLVVPRRLLAEQVAESPHRALQLLLSVGQAGLLQAAHRHVQVGVLAPGQGEVSALVFCTHRAARAPVGAPDGVALAAGDERVVDSLVGLGLLRGRDGNGVDNGGGGLDGLDGLHCLRVACGSWGLGNGFSLRGPSFQFYFRFDKRSYAFGPPPPLL